MSMDINTSNKQLQYQNDETQINFTEWIIFIIGEKKLILTIYFLIIFISLIYCFTVKPTFTAKTIILTNINQQSSLSASSSSISSILNASSLYKSQEDMYLSLLQSDFLLNQIINKLNLTEKYNTNIYVDLRQLLKNTTKVYADKRTSFITIEIVNEDPDFAKNLANTYVDELRNMIGSLALETAQQKVLFFQKAISKTQDDLTLAKNKFENAKEMSGVISASNLTESAYSQISSKELQLSAMKHFSTNQNSDIRRIEAELSALRDQLFKTENLSKNNSKTDSSNKNGIDAYREIKSLEMLLSTLTSQYRISITEAFSNDPFIHQIEKASTPERRTSPKRTQIIIFNSIFGLLFGIIVSVIKIYFRKNINAYNNYTLIKKSILNN